MRITSNAILIRDNKVLLGKRPKDKKVYPDQWDVIGGHVKEGETIEEAMFREVREEVDVLVIKFRKLDEILEETEKGIEYKHYYFLVTDWRGEIKNLSDLEKIEWFSKDQIDSLKMSEFQRNLIKRLLK